jgi:hypothetical protein
MHLADHLALKDMIELKRLGSGPAKDRRDAVIRLLDRAWFRRAWVYQEAVVAAEVEVYCGYLCVPFGILARLVLSTLSHEARGRWHLEYKVQEK